MIGYLLDSYRIFTHENGRYPINVTYRNGHIKNLHAGKTLAYPLDKRRCTSREARNIVRFTAERLGAVVATLPVWHEPLQEMLPLRLRSRQAWPKGIGRIVATRDYPRIGHSRKQRIHRSAPGLDDVRNAFLDS
jgi:hypothetical protein